ncbi:helix-turn-helix domain-containing protein [Candidatus Nomurabacteria bacterium]|nr:helix-turn-helix domain-containing protein [Candidatus Nomurabacteria bacterium]
MDDFNITLFEACELLNRSKKSISRYIRRGLLHPEKVKSQQGTLEYRFSKADIEAFKAQEAQRADETRQDTADRTDETGQTGHIKTGFIENKEILSESRQDTPEQTGHGRQDTAGQESEVITLLKETTGLLRDQLKTKDEQIKDLGGKIDQLIERDRETNILIGQLQSKVLMLEQPKEAIISELIEEIRQDTTNKTGQDEPKPKKNTGKASKEARKQEKKGIVKWLFG